MKKILSACISIFFAISNINAQHDITKSIRKICLGFNFTYLKVFETSKGSSFYGPIDDFYNNFKMPSFEIDIYSRIYLHKNFYLKPSLNYSKFHRYQRDYIHIYNGPQTLFYATIAVKEKVDKLKVFLPIGLGLPKRRFSFFLEGGFGFNPFINVEDEVDYRMNKIDTNVFEIKNSIEKINNFVPSHLRFF